MAIENDLSKLAEIARQSESVDSFLNDTLIHVTNVEPRIGDFMRNAYECDGDGTFEEMGGVPLAFYARLGDIERIKHIANGCHACPRWKTPFVLLVETPDDALVAIEDDNNGMLFLVTMDDELFGYEPPLGVEPNDIISYEGSEVIAQIPMNLFPQTRDKLIEFYESVVS